MSVVANEVTADMESVEDFRLRARAWIADNLQMAGHQRRALRNFLPDDEELEEVARERAIQRKLFDGGFAGICVPKAYGGQGLTPAHQKALNEEMAGREYPSRLQSPTMSPLLAVILEFGTEAQKLEHVPKMLKGEEIWMQFLSEPSGGSDVAGALSSAVRDGDEWILNGSKIWTTGAWWSDWGLFLARTNWDVPKHRGLTVFMLPLYQPGIEVHRIEMLNGNREFCQEFLTDVRVPDSDRVGEVDDGWTVGTRWMFHERMLFNSPYVTIPSGGGHGIGNGIDFVGVARAAGRLHDPVVRDLIGAGRTIATVAKQLDNRMNEGIRAGTISDQASAISRLMHGVSGVEGTQIMWEITGAAGGVWDEDDGTLEARGIDYLMRQTGCIGGGTTEIARNVISERVLGMQREASGDKNIPFRDVPRGPSLK